MTSPSQIEGCGSTLFQHFEHLAGTPDAVPKLRSLILDLAIRGHLVPQNPDDPPASNLVQLARSQTKEQRKPQRASNGNASAQQPLFALPQGWCWTCLDDLGDTAPRNELPDKTEVGFSPMRLVTAKFGEPISFERRPWAEVRKGFTHFADGDVVVAKITPCFENGKSGVIRAAPNGFGAGTTELHVLRPVSKCVLPEYVLIFLKSPHFLLNGEAHMTGSAGQKRVPWTYFAKTAFPLPPLPEQRRIVAKVEELLALCDELEARQTTTRERRTRLVHSALDHLTSAKNEQDLRTHAQFILHNSSLILDSVPGLRQAILSLAVQGRLATASPKDSTAARLPLAATLEAPISCPKHWAWCRLDTVLTFGPTNGLSPKPVSFPTKTRVLTLTATTSGTFRSDCYKYVAQEIEEDSELWLRPGDILIQRGNSLDYVGIAARYEGANKEFIYPDLMIKIRLADSVNPHFAHLVLNSPYGREFFRSRATGTSGSMPKVNQGVVRSFPIPLVPKAEQERIVAKVTELTRWCDELETHLATAQMAGSHFLDACLNQILQPAQTSA